jgi:glycosyltransferase involved in cell wall biosynthesis
VSTVHVVVPAAIDDRTRPSGGNVYDRRICSGLTTLGWTVHEHPVSGSWPWPDAAAERSLASELARIPDTAVVLVDGLIASGASTLLVAGAHRFRLVVLVHMLFGDCPTGDAPTDAQARERTVLAAATRIITTSWWTFRQLVGVYGLPPEGMHVAQPGVDTARSAEGTTGGGALLCVAAVAPAKGHDVLLAALAALSSLGWSCVCVGSLETDPGFVERLRHQVEAAGIGHRVRLVGAQSGDALDQAYLNADLLVLASRAESYGMVVAEALAHGLPVVASAVGGLPEALGRAPDGRVPGILVPPADQQRLTEALSHWLLEPDLRKRLRQAARERQASQVRWADTTTQVARTLIEAGA